MSRIKTPYTHPNHETIGRVFKGYSVKHSKAALYFCDSYDPDCGFWMTNIQDIEDRNNVSERAIGRTYHRDYSGDAEAIAAQWVAKREWETPSSEDAK